MEKQKTKTRNEKWISETRVRIHQNRKAVASTKTTKLYHTNVNMKTPKKIKIGFLKLESEFKTSPKRSEIVARTLTLS